MPRRPHSLAFVLATLVATVMLLGLPRLLVVCSGGEANAAHVAFVHTHETCCAHDHERDDTPVPGDTPSARDGTHCEHGTFAIGLAQPPRPFLANWTPPPALATVGIVATFAPVQRDAEPHVHALTTGPPRPDDWLDRRRTTLLQV